MSEERKNEQLNPEEIDGYAAPVGANKNIENTPVAVNDKPAAAPRVQPVPYPAPVPPQNEKKKGIPKFVCVILGMLLGIAISGLVVFIIGTQFLNSYLNSNGKVIQYNNEDKLNTLRSIMEQYYLHPDDVTDERLQDGMYKGMVDSLGDPYTVYYTEQEYNSLLESTSGTFEGVGLYLSQDPETKRIVVSKPMEGTPGEQAGILADDVLIKVNDEDIQGMDLSVVVTKVKGPGGTSVKLTFLRDGKEMDFDVVRAKIETPTVKHEMKDADKGIGYIYIGEFDEVTYQQFMDALEDLKSQGMKSLVIDLRDNPGGSLDTVCKICDELLPEGLIVYCEDNSGKRKEYSSDANQSYTGDMVVLVNGNSASASEIMTGALKDYGLAKIVGTTTFGKGIVQSVIPLGDGTAIKITVQDYFTPKGNNIHGVGIDPDVEIELDVEAYKKDQTDNQLDKALEILGGK